MTELGRITLGGALHERIEVLEGKVSELTGILDALLFELEEGTDPKKAAMVARDYLEYASGLGATGTD